MVSDVERRGAARVGCLVLGVGLLHGLARLVEQVARFEDVRDDAADVIGWDDNAETVVKAAAAGLRFISTTKARFLAKVAWVRRKSWLVVGAPGGVVLTLLYRPV